MRVGYKLCVAGLGLVLAASASAIQTVTPVKDGAGTNFPANGANSWATTASAGGTLVFFGRYSSDNANESGLGLSVNYDGNVFSNVVVDQLLTKCMVATPQVVEVAGPSHVFFGWADTSIRRTNGTANGAVGWTGSVDPALPGTTDGCLNPGNIVQASSVAAVTPPTNLFRITANVAAGFSVGQISTITFQGTSFSKAGGQNSGGFTTQSLVITSSALAFNGAASRKTHGAAGVFDIPIDPSGSLTAGQPITIEPRAIGTGHQIVFTFSAPVSSSGAPTTTSGVASAPVFQGNNAVVTLTGVTDLTRVQVNLPGVNGSAVSAAANVGFVLGDVNGSRGVTGSDVSIVKSKSGQTTDATNFKMDLNASGGVTGSDVSIVKSRSGQLLN
jgi:hypothetical protein